MSAIFPGGEFLYAPRDSLITLLPRREREKILRKRLIPFSSVRYEFSSCEREGRRGGGLKGLMVVISGQSNEEKREERRRKKSKTQREGNKRKKERKRERW